MTAFDANLTPAKAGQGSEPVKWDVSLTDRPAGKTPPVQLAEADAPRRFGGPPPEVPVIRQNDIRTGDYPSTIRPVDIGIIRTLIKDAPSLAGMSSGEVFETFLHNYNDRSHEAIIPPIIRLTDASTQPAVQEKSGWSAATDPALYYVDPNLHGSMTGRNLKPVRDTAAKTNAKEPDSIYVIGYDKQSRPSNVLEYYNDGTKTRYRDQYLFKYDERQDGSEVVSVFKYRAADQSRGRDNSDAPGTIPIGANGRANVLEGMTQYFRLHGETYAIRKWDGSTMELGRNEDGSPNELKSRPRLSGALDRNGVPITQYPPIEEVTFDDFRLVDGKTQRTIFNHEGHVVVKERNHDMRTVSARDYKDENALRAAFNYAKDFYFYDPFGPKIPNDLPGSVPTPYDPREILDSGRPFLPR